MSSATTETPIDQSSIEKVASGQKLIIYAILVNLFTFALVAVFGDEAGLLSIVAVALSLVGLVRLASGMRYSVGMRTLLVFLRFVPLMNIITLLVLNSRATKALRAAGYRVGLLGASR